MATPYSRLSPSRRSGSRFSTYLPFLGLVALFSLIVLFSFSSSISNSESAAQRQFQDTPQTTVARDSIRKRLLRSDQPTQSIQPIQSTQPTQPADDSSAPEGSQADAKEPESPAVDSDQFAGVPLNDEPSFSEPIPVPPARPEPYQCIEEGLEYDPPQVDKLNGNIHYGVWRMRYPHFIEPAHVDWWKRYEVVTWRRSMRCEEREGWLTFCEKGYVRGEVRMMHDVVVADVHGHDCGPNGDINKIVRAGQGKPIVHEVPVLFYSRIPATWTFQHWMENTLPKLAQASMVMPEITTWTNITTNQELQLHKFPIIQWIHDHLHMKVVDELPNAIKAQTLLYSCVTPPLHPYLWQLGQERFLRLPPPQAPAKRRRIVYCSRTAGGHTDNTGRRVLNEDELLRHMRQSFPQYELTIFNHAQFHTVQELIDFFADTVALIGPHGGCLTNILFLPCNTFVLELFPLVNGIKPPLGHPGMMMYMQAMFLRQQYWMLPVTTRSHLGDMNVPLDQFSRILQTALNPNASRSEW